MNREQVFEITLGKLLEPIGTFLADDSISEIMINGPKEIFIERGGQLERTPCAFGDEDSLLRAARNIAQYSGKRLTAETARLDGRLPDGSRVHMVFAKNSRKGLCLSIRKFSRRAFSLTGLTELGVLSPEAREYLEIIIALGRNLIVSGGTGTGKTSLLNAISAAIPTRERIVVIEDTTELKLQQPHVLSFEATPANRYGRGEVTIRDLFHSALRMRPDRIVIGECRGGEALDLIQALTSGHGGSMSSLHADSPVDALNRLETMALMSGVNLPLWALRSQIASAIDVIVQLSRQSDGRRVVTQISEVGALSSNNTYLVTDIFQFRASAPASATDRTCGLKWTQTPSRFTQDIQIKHFSNRVVKTKAIFLT